MTLTRTLEPEVMDSARDAQEYDRMDHTAANAAFVDDLVAAIEAVPSFQQRIRSEFAQDDPDLALGVLDVGTGTAQLPIQLVDQLPAVRVMAIDLATHMLDLARLNVEAAGLIERISLARVDAKQMPFESGMFDVVISNSIVHHIPQPLECLKSMLNVSRPGGLLFVRDLMRPKDTETVERLVATYAGEESEYSQTLFRQSLHAALSLTEIRQRVEQLGLDPDAVQATSDRHWTWRTEIVD